MTGPDKNDLPYPDKFVDLAGPEAHGFHAFHGAAECVDGAIPEKRWQLAMLAVALTTQRQKVSGIVHTIAAVCARGAVARKILALRCFENSEPLT